MLGLLVPWTPTPVSGPFYRETSVEDSLCTIGGCLAIDTNFFLECSNQATEKLSMSSLHSVDGEASPVGVDLFLDDTIHYDDALRVSIRWCFAYTVTSVYGFFVGNYFRGFPPKSQDSAHRNAE